MSAEPIADLLAHSIAAIYKAPHESLRLAEEASRLAKLGCEPKLHIAVLEQQMNMLFATGQIHEGCAVLMPALVIAEQENLERERGVLLQNLGMAHYTLAEYNTAIDYWSDCLYLGHRDFANETRIHAHIGIGQIYYAFHQFADALRHHQLAQTWLTPDIGDELRVRLNINLIADLYELARYADAESLLQETEQLCPALIQNKLEYTAEVFTYKTLIALAKEQYPEAKRFIEQGQQRIEFWAWGEVSWNIVCGRIQHAEGQHTAAIVSFETALATAMQINCGHKIALIHQLLALSHRELQQLKAAEYHHRRYHEYYHRLADPVIFTRLKELEQQLCQ